MATIELAGVRKVWGTTAAIEEVSFVAEEATFVVLLGPSGCGKSTTLRLIAGLEQVSAGSVRIDGRDVTSLSPAQRRISMVFQSYALFPHLNVAENIVFGLKVRKVPAAERQARLSRVIELVGLEGLLERKPSQLSGGQRQRVALARAIIAENAICLMDEPLSNLDAKLRNEMRAEIRALQARLGMTVIYVTHDQTEAMSMADKVVLMREGRVEQEGTPDELYQRPRTTFAAQFIGTPPMNLIEAAPGADGHRLLAALRPGVTLGVRPEAIRLDPEGVRAEALGCDYLGADSIVTVRMGERPVLVRLPGHVRVRPGERVGLAWPEEAVHRFDTSTGIRLEE